MQYESFPRLSPGDQELGFSGEIQTEKDLSCAVVEFDSGPWCGTLLDMKQNSLPPLERWTSVQPQSLEAGRFGSSKP